MERLRQAGFADVAIESRQSYGLENLESLDEGSREALGLGVDWQTVPADVRLYSARIVARKPGASQILGHTPVSLNDGQNITHQV